MCNKKTLSYLVFQELIGSPVLPLCKESKDVVKGLYTNQISLEAEHIFFLNHISGNRRWLNKWKVFKFSLASFLKSLKWKIIGISTIFLLMLGFLYRLDNVYLKLLAISFWALGETLFTYFWLEFYDKFSSADSTFSMLENIFKEIQEYTKDFGISDSINLNSEASIIARNITKRKIVRLKNPQRRTCYILLSTFLLALTTACILGDSLISEIQWIANILGLQDFVLFKDLTFNKFIIFMVFPLSSMTSSIAVNFASKKMVIKLTHYLEHLKENYD